MTRDIYVIFYLDGDVKHYFYIGRTKDLSRRMKEHRYQSRAGHEDKYTKIRELEAQGIKYDFEVIQTIPSDQYVPDAERWHVIRLTREGHDLTNMRHGSRERREELTRQVKDMQIRSVADVRSEREQRKQEGYERSKRLRDRIDMQSTLAAFRNGVKSVRNSQEISPRHRELLLKAAGVWESGEDVRVSADKRWDVNAVRCQLDVERWTKFHEWRRTIPLPLD